MRLTFEHQTKVLKIKVWEDRIQELKMQISHATRELGYEGINAGEEVDKLREIHKASESQAYGNDCINGNCEV